MMGGFMRLPGFISDRIIRHHARFDRIATDRFVIRVARTLEEYESAFRLVHISYAYLGIEPMRPVDLRVTEQHALREAIVLVAYESGQPVGTITVTGDSPAGLPLDADYPMELSDLRSSGARPAEVGSFAIVGRCRKGGLAQLLAMAATRIAFRTLSASHIVIGINPHASSVYRAVWGFEPLGAPRIHASLSAPVAGHVVRREQLLSHVRTHFPRPMTSGSLPESHLLMGPPLPCVSVPNDSLNPDLSVFKMPREVFRSLFIDHGERWSRLSANTRAHVKRQRTEETLRATLQLLRKVV
jgi:hypothetical protein